MKKTAKLMLALLAFGCLASSAQAASTTTKGKVKFESDNSAVKPVDPGNPNVPIEPNRPPSEGPLSISYVSNLDFGINEISDKDMTYYAKLDTIKTEKGESKKVANFIQFSDVSGSSKGWKLLVNFISPLKNTENYSIKGTELHISQGKATSNTEGATSVLPTVANKITIPTDSTEPVLVAQREKGMGSWNIIFGEDKEDNKSIGLFVPGKSEKVAGSYTTKLLWTLSNEF